ncbi:MAG: glycosyl transferase 2 family protein [Firmicutes bacterium]|nr:glycosyl transferase 2 family protein [Bacillota bacterium]
MTKNKQTFAVAPEQKIKFSIIIPAYNEENYITKCLDSIVVASASFKEQVEVIVVLNRCTDRTEEIALSYGCITVKEDAKNLSKIRNAGAKIAKGEIIVTIDADSWMSENMLIEIEKEIMTEKYIGGGVSIKGERTSIGLMLSSLVIIFAVITQYGLISVGLFWCLKKDFDAIKGFDENLPLAEDVNFALRLRSWGKQCGKKFKTITKAYITTSSRKHDMFGDWQWFKNAKGIYKLLKRANPELACTLAQEQEVADKVWYDVKR